MPRMMSGVACALLTTSVVVLSANAIEDDLAFEAEHADAIEFPMAIAEDEDASGGEYILSPNGRAGWADYEVEIPADEDYYMWGMVQKHDGVTDSFFVTFDEVARGDDNDDNPNTWDIGAAADIWLWDPVSGRGVGGDPREFELTQGLHTLRIWTRENNAWLDSIFMSTEEDAQPVLASEFEGRGRLVEPKAVRYIGQLAVTWGQLRVGN